MQKAKATHLIALKVLFDEFKSRRGATAMTGYSWKLWKVIRNFYPPSLLLKAFLSVLAGGHIPPHTNTSLGDIISRHSDILYRCIFWWHLLQCFSTFQLLINQSENHIVPYWADSTRINKKKVKRQKNIWISTHLWDIGLIIQNVENNKTKNILLIVWLLVYNRLLSK